MRDCLRPMFRLDRLLTIGLYRALIRSKLIKRKLGIPILMYHSISEDFEPVAHPYYQTSTSPNTFRKHMAFLYQNGYTVLPLREAVDLLQKGQVPDGRPVVLTFDDGFRDFYWDALPILQEYGFPSVVFLPTAFIDDPQSKFKGRSCLSWEEVRQLHKHGVDFGSHTVTHAALTALRLDQLRAEIELSKQRIELELGERINSFAYPYAFPEDNADFTKLLKAILHSAGYRHGVTTIIGVATGHEDPMFFKRIPVNQSDDLDLLQAKLAGAYDWVHPLQRFVKWVKRTTENRRPQSAQSSIWALATESSHAKCEQASPMAGPGNRTAT